MRQPRRLTPSLSLSLALPLAALAATAAAGCSLNPVPLDPNNQPAADCTGAAIPLIACAVGETVPVCTRDSAGRSRWTITCPGQPDAGPMTTEPEPTTTSVNLQLQNGGAAAAYVYQGCLIDFTITALTDPPVTINRVEGCVCECGRNDCPTCGQCYAGPLEIPAGGQVIQSWLTANVTNESGGVRGSCQRLHALPAGSYRIELPVYATQAEAAAKVLPRVVTQVFTLPAPQDTVAIPFSLATGAP